MNMKWLCLGFNPYSPIISLFVCRNVVAVSVLFCSPLLWAQQYSFHELDWHNKVPTEINHCNGYYQPPVITSKNPDMPATQQPIYHLAKTSEYHKGVMTLKGMVEIQQGRRIIYSDQAVVNTVANTVDLQGNVSYRKPDLLLRGQQARFNGDTRTTVIDHAQMVAHNLHLRGKANQIIYNEDGTIVLDKGSFTYCEPGNSFWSLHGDNIEIDPQQGFGHAYNTQLKLGSISVLYLPWISFPVNDQRKSGFLYPKMNLSNGDLNLITPYYLNLAPNYDLTITPEKTYKRGILLSALGRHITPNNSQSIELAWTPKDGITQQQRWLLDFNHQGQLNSNWDASLSYSRISDVNFISDFTYHLTKDTATSLKNSATLNYQATNSNSLLTHFSGNVTSYQHLTNGIAPFDALPSLTWFGNGYIGTVAETQPATSWINSTTWFYNLNYTHFQRNLAGLSAADRIVGQRIHLQPTLQQHWSHEAAFIKSTVSLPMTQYWLDNQISGYDSNPSRMLLQLQLDSGLLFERDISAMLKQTLEPRLYYAYTPYKNQDQIPLFDTSDNNNIQYTANRFSGSDRIGDTNHIIFGIDSQFLTETGYQKAKLSLAQVHYLRDRRVQLIPATATEKQTSSPIYGRITYNFTPSWNANFNADWNPHTAKWEQLSSNMGYIDYNNNQKINLAYNYQNTANEQAELSLIWPVASKWTLLAQHRVDLLNQQTQESTIGFEFTNCCFQTRLVNRYWLDTADQDMQRGIFFELALRNLSSVGQQLTGANQTRMAEFMQGITSYNENYQ